MPYPPKVKATVFNVFAAEALHHLRVGPMREAIWPIVLAGIAEDEALGACRLDGWPDRAARSG